ncbi:hypothetical protein D0T53_03995 [Dysgonomonas sp. 216]|uniref:hypothetical protein n=1 Tax=Dysgonomonas sp. 216 TaxID=2302934 RepID=UPI0013D43AB6|nr:hypothetical protein [Dysgonomonas sp. 216]NDW18079.1 hypothetical protein [Dysgonomonas sp. 216]
MKRLLFIIAIAAMLTSCGTAYNDSLKKIELGMTPEQVVSLMGDKYTVVAQKDYSNQTIEYRDRYKNNWYFVFVDGHLNKWYKETDE